jgi:branched-chain amino acid transport system substrate-binding protein
MNDAEAASVEWELAMKAIGRLGRGVLAGLVLAIGAAGLAGCDKPAEKAAPAPAASGTSPTGAADAASGTADGQSAASGAGAATSPGPAKGEPIKVGHYASITGSEATFGQSTDNGIKLAVEERNAAGGVMGRPIQLITYDNQGKQQETTTVVTRLVQQDKVVALLGEVASSRSMAGGPIAQKAGVPMITPSSTNPDVTAIGDMIFRVCFIDPFQGYVGAKFAKDNLKKTRAATLYNRAQAYSDGLNNNFIESFEQMGGTVATQQAYGDGDNDFSAQLAAIKEANVEFIYVPGYYTEVVNIAKQARKIGLNIPLIGGDGWDSEELKNAGTALDGCFFSNHYAKEDTRAEVQDFIAKYQAKFDGEPDGLAALGYDAARLLFESMDKAGSLDGKAIAAQIAATKGFQGVTGRITIDAERNANKDAVVLEITNGVPKYVATVPAPTE